MRRVRREERGQAMVEMALIILPLLMLTAGLIDVGRAFYQYTGISAAARYAARWGAVAGGTCATNDAILSATSTTDWCHQMGSDTTHFFWQQSGNAPGQGTDVTCPTTLPSASVLPAGTSSGGYYNVSLFAPPNASTSTTIVGTVAQHFDTNSSSSGFTLGAYTPGFDLTEMWACVELIRGPKSAATADTIHFLQAGDRVRVYVYYRFSAATPLLPTQNFPAMVAEAEFPVA